MNTMIRKFPGLLFLFCLVAAPALTGAAKAHASWQEEWKKTLAAAKKEGKVTVYTSSRQSNLLLESGAFQKSTRTSNSLWPSEIHSTES